jgi:hypothetical protein
MLWAAFGGLTEDAAIERYWNAFGVYRPDRPAQTPIVEINILTQSNNANVAGFFAKDSETGDIFLMHSGKVGGGRPGIGKNAFLVSSKAKLIDILSTNRDAREGIAIGKLSAPDLADRIWTFVEKVQNFKDQADAGTLETDDFKQTPFQVRSATVQHRRHGGVNGRGKGQGQGL